MSPIKEPMPHRSLHGVFPICATPFTADDEIDMPGLRRIVEHIVGSGAHGIVYPAIASEFQTLSEVERRAAVDAVSTATAGRTALVIGISSNDPEAPPRLAREAAALGADAVILMPAPRLGDDEAALESLFCAVAARCDRPIILQNAPPPLGPALPTESVLRLMARVPQVRYVKEETPPCGQRISALIAGASDTLLGVFGGAGGRFLIDELARGAAGSMPACELARIHVDIYETYRAGNHRRARALSACSFRCSTSRASTAPPQPNRSFTRWASSAARIAATAILRSTRSICANWRRSSPTCTAPTH